MKSLVIFALLLGIGYSQCGSIQPYSSQSESRTIGGWPATKSQFPFVVRLEIEVYGAPILCGGSLISRRYVLTTGSCLKKTPVILIRVLLGTVDTYRTSRAVETNAFVVHPKFDPRTYANDIGLVDMMVNVVVTDDVSPIKLVPLSQASNTFVDAMATVAGWGQTVTGLDGVQSRFLNYVNVSVISNDDCKVIYPSLVDAEVCTIGKDNSSQGGCYGDQGSPLFLADSDGRMMQIGITSFFGLYGCESGRPKGYVRPHHYWQWIVENSDLQLS